MPIKKTLKLGKDALGIEPKKFCGRFEREKNLKFKKKSNNI